MTILLTWISTRRSGLANQAAPYACSVVWVLDGTEEDVKKAQAFCDGEAKKADGTEMHKVRQLESKDVDPFKSGQATATSTAAQGATRTESRSAGIEAAGFSRASKRATIS